ncbi:PIG-L family deacetylase [Candidatus Woesearchaeota archaeon]|nr:PIG-L family deacetylase [Candidatus Woesearchaeota archaeon]
MVSVKKPLTEKEPGKGQASGRCDYDVLFFSAHPDDAEFGAGGTLLLLAKKFKVANIILTRGEAGTYGTPEIREKETGSAARLAGIDFEFLDFRDNFVEDNAENAHMIAHVIRKYRPRIIFAPYHTNSSSHLDGVSHPDHTATGSLVLKAARFAKFKNARLKGEAHAARRIVYFMVPRYTKPSLIIDVSQAASSLKKLWACHKSQVQNLAKGKLEERLLSSRRALGQLAGVSYAEGFLVEEPLRIDEDWLFKI